MTVDRSDGRGDGSDSGDNGNMMTVMGTCSDGNTMTVMETCSDGNMMTVMGT